MRHLILIVFRTVAAAFLLMGTYSSRAVPGDEHWDVQFGWPGPGGNTDSIATHNGKVYASGAGSVTTNVALQVWDGIQWTTLAQFYGPPSGTIIFDLAFVGDTLYAAGTFTNVNGVNTGGGLAAWDGANWSGFSGLSGSALGLTVDSGVLYVTGAFIVPAAGGVVATNIAIWDGSAWHALGNGLGIVNGLSSGARGTAVKNGLVYVVGLFTNSGPDFVTNAAVWDGSDWTAIGGGLNGLGETIGFNGNDLYVGGTFSAGGPTPAALIVRWDGTSWFPVGNGLTGSAVTSLTILNGSVYVAGSFNVTGVQATNFAVWNGSSWTGVNPSIIGNGSRVYATATNVLVGGNFQMAGNLIANSLAAWDGAQWSTFGAQGRMNGASFSVRTFAGVPTNLFVGGAFATVGQLTNATMVAHFDGANWSSMSGGVSGALSVVNALATSNNVVYVGGTFSSAGAVSAQNIALWDGANWSAMGSGPGGQVSAIVVTTNGVYAVGAPQSGSTFGSPFFSRWDGANWVPSFHLGSGTFFTTYLNDNNFPFNALAVQGTNIFIGGHFKISTLSPSLACSNIMRFDGTNCQTMATGVNSNVIAMAVLGTNLYVAGLFTNAGGLPASHIAKWDGNAWSGVGGGVVGSGTVNALTTIGTNLYAGGSFTNIGGVTVNRIAKWDGSTWSALGSGVSFISGPSSVLGLYASGSNLYAGGSFRTAGGKPSVFLGKWNEQVNFNTPQLSNPAWPGAGQFRARVYGVSGTTNVIEATTDFSSWIPILTNSTGIYDFIDSSAGGFTQRFYRARLVP